MVYKYAKNMGGNPAMVNIDTGVVYINKPLWDKLSDYEKAIILLHEEGHYKNHSLDEIKADCYAISQYLKDCNSPERRWQLKQTIFGIVPSDQENAKRKIAFVRNLLQYDSNVNNNQDSLNTLKFIDSLNEAEEGDFSSNTANAVGAVVGVISVISTGLKLGTQILSFIKANKEAGIYWHELSSSEKNRYINEAAQAVITETFYSEGGRFSAVIALAQLPPSNPRSIACKVFEVLSQTVPMAQREFNGAAQLTAEDAANIFWSKQGFSISIQTWMSNKANAMQKNLESAWESLSFFDKVSYSYRYKIYVLLFIVAAFIVWKI